MKDDSTEGAPEDVVEQVEETSELEEGPEEEPVEEPTPEAQESAKAKQSEELKIVIIVNPGGTMIGVQSPDCDPVYTTLKGNLAAALKRVPKLVEEAKQKWDANPLYPKAELPEPRPSSTPARTTTAPKSKPDQPSFF